MKKYFQRFLEKSMVHTPSIPHFKGLGKINLQYQIPKKNHNKDTMT